jgi:HPt (histidine-containing phosphotransfer) domain-containing protein
MTANVMTEDRARVLAVGMNGHVAKPISQRELFETLLKWIPPLRSSSPEELATSGSAIPSSEVKLPAELPGFDLPRALVNLGGNRRLLRKLLADLHGAHHSDVVAIHDALREDRWKDAERLAHTLKTVAGTLAAAELQRSASALEMVLRRGEHGQAEEILTRLRSVMEPLMAGLARWLHQEESASAAATPVDDANAGDPLVSSRRAQAQRLLQLLEELDPQAHEEALELAKGLPAEHPAHAVASAAAGYDFDTARTLLEKLIAPKP